MIPVEWVHKNYITHAMCANVPCLWCGANGMHTEMHTKLFWPNTLHGVYKENVFDWQKCQQTVEDSQAEHYHVPQTNAQQPISHHVLELIIKIFLLWYSPFFNFFHSSNHITNLHTPQQFNCHVDGLVQERCKSIANSLELHLSCTKPSMYCATFWSDLIITFNVKTWYII